MTQYMIIPLLVVLMAVGCAEATATPPATPTATSAPENRPSADAPATTTPSGLQYRDLEVGDGQPAAAGETVVVHYTGWLEDGTKFDSSLDRGEPFQFVVGRGDVIPGWDEGVGSMRVGGKRELTIPARLAYGDQGVPGVIPPGATLIFEVELLEVK